MSDERLARVVSRETALVEIRRICAVGTEGHGDEFYGPILAVVGKVDDIYGIDTSDV